MKRRIASWTIAFGLVAGVLLGIACETEPHSHQHEYSFVEHTHGTTLHTLDVNAQMARELRKEIDALKDKVQKLERERDRTPNYNTTSTIK